MRPLSSSALLFLGSLFAALPSEATVVNVGQIINDPGYDFSSFGNNANGTTRGANFGGTFLTTFNGVLLRFDRTGAQNGISWTGGVSDASASGGSPGIYDYTPLAYGYTGNPATGTDANHIANTGISGNPTIAISATPGAQYTIDLLFANAFGPRTLDVSVEGGLFLDNLGLDLSDARPLVYRFTVTPLDNQINIALTPGSLAGFSDTNPYVNAIMVTQVVPEPAGLGLIALATCGGMLLRRRR